MQDINISLKQVTKADSSSFNSGNPKFLEALACFLKNNPSKDLPNSYNSWLTSLKNNDLNALLLLICTDAFLRICVMDPTTGLGMTTDSSLVLSKVNEALKSNNYIVQDRLSHVIKHSLSALDFLTKNIHKNLIRRHEMIPAFALKEVDSTTISWMSKQVGRNFAERLGVSGKILAPVRRWSSDTVENRILKQYMLDLVNQLDHKYAVLGGTSKAIAFFDQLGKILNKTDFYEYKESSLSNLLMSFLYTEDFTQINKINSLQPNNLLLQDRYYHKIWESFLWFKDLDLQIKADFKQLPQLVINDLFWKIASVLSISNKIKFLHVPCNVDISKLKVSTVYGKLFSNKDFLENNVLFGYFVDSLHKDPNLDDNLFVKIVPAISFPNISNRQYSSSKEEQNSFVDSQELSGNVPSVIKAEDEQSSIDESTLDKQSQNIDPFFKVKSFDSFTYEEFTFTLKALIEYYINQINKDPKESYLLVLNKGEEEFSLLRKNAFLFFKNKSNFNKPAEFKFKKTNPVLFDLVKSIKLAVTNISILDSAISYYNDLLSHEKDPWLQIEDYEDLFKAPDEINSNNEQIVTKVQDDNILEGNENDTNSQVDLKQEEYLKKRRIGEELVENLLSTIETPQNYKGTRESVKSKAVNCITDNFDLLFVKDFANFDESKIKNTLKINKILKRDILYYQLLLKVIDSCREYANKLEQEAKEQITADDLSLDLHDSDIFGLDADYIKRLKLVNKSSIQQVSSFDYDRNSVFNYNSLNNQESKEISINYSTLDFLVDPVSQDNSIDSGSLDCFDFNLALHHPNVEGLSKQSYCILQVTSQNELKIITNNNVVTLSFENGVIKLVSNNQSTLQDCFFTKEQSIPKVLQTICWYLLKENNALVSYHKDRLEFKDTVCIDICSLVPRFFAGEGRKSQSFGIRQICQQWALDDSTNNFLLDCSQATALFNDSNYPIYSICDVLFNYYLDPLTKDNSARYLMNTLCRSFTAPSLIYLVPDSLNDFSLKSIRQSLVSKYSQAYPLPCSIALVYDYLFNHPYKFKDHKQYGFVVLSIEGTKVVFTPIKVAFDQEVFDLCEESRGFVLDRYPSFTFDYSGQFSFNSSSQNTSNLSFISPLDLLSLQDQLCLATVYRDEKNEDNIEISSYGEDAYTSIKNTLDNFKVPLRLISELFNKWQFDLEHNLLISNFRCKLDKLVSGKNFRFDFTDSNDSVRGGYYLQKIQNQVGFKKSLWFDNLPKLALKASVNGEWKPFDIVSETDCRITPVFGQVNTIDIEETFELPATPASGKYSLPLMINSFYNIDKDTYKNFNLDSWFNYQAVIEPEIPFTSPVKCRLEMTYTYGAEQPYNLVFVPLDPQYAPMVVKWIDGDDSDVKSLIPNFPTFESFTEACSSFFAKQDRKHQIIKSLDYFLDYIIDSYNYFRGLDTFPRFHISVASVKWSETHNKQYILLNNNDMRIVNNFVKSLQEQSEEGIEYSLELYFLFPKNVVTSIRSNNSSIAFSLKPTADNKIRPAYIAIDDFKWSNVQDTIKTIKDKVIDEERCFWTSMKMFWKYGIEDNEFEGTEFKDKINKATDCLSYLIKSKELPSLSFAAIFDSLSLMHKYAPKEYWNCIDELLDNFDIDGNSKIKGDLLISLKKSLFNCDYNAYAPNFWNIGYAVGDVSTDSQKKLLHVLVRLVCSLYIKTPTNINGNASKNEDVSNSVRVLCEAIWASENVVKELYLEEIKKLIDKITEILVSIRLNMLEPNNFIIGNILSLILALLRTRGSTNKQISSLLKVNSYCCSKLVTEVKYLSELSDFQFLEKFIPPVIITCNKPETRQNIPDLIYAVDMYLTGDSGANDIKITSSSFDL